VPIAFVSTALAVASWFLAVPAQMLIDRGRPANAGDYL
jgi:hypothetical protein